METKNVSSVNVKAKFSFTHDSYRLKKKQEIAMPGDIAALLEQGGQVVILGPVEKKPSVKRKKIAAQVSASGLPRE